MLYACDGAWWVHHRPAFAGLKLTNCRAISFAHHVTVQRTADTILFGEPGSIGDGGNSGFQALNIAVQFGARRIALVGFDMRLDLGFHWHGAHPRPLNNPRQRLVERWRDTMDRAASTLRLHDVEVVNTSPQSALTAYRVAPLHQLIEEWR